VGSQVVERHVRRAVGARGVSAAVLTCALHGTAFNYGCPGCNAADDWQIVKQVAPRLEDECDGHEWRELEPDVSECVKCQTLRFAAATMDQLERYLLGSP